ATVLDLGTGTGAIALAIAAERPLAEVTAVDVSAAALAVARDNAEEAGVPLRLLQGDWFEPVADERFDLVVRNPPYIAEDDPHLSQGDLRFEPRTALASGKDGLDAIRAIIAAAPKHLKPGGWLLLEHGHDQGAAVRGLLVAAGFVRVGTERDLEQRDRVGFGRWPGGARPSVAQPERHPPVQRPPGLAGVVGHRPRFAVALGRQPVRRHALADQP